MTKIRNLARDQLMIASLDQLVDQESEARQIDSILKQADLVDLGFEIKGKSNQGRPSYEEFALLAIYVYGYLNGIRSSRKLCRACKKDLDLQWLCDGIRPSQKTVSDFRRINAASLSNLFYWFNKYLLNMGLMSGNEFGVDGTLIRGQNSASNNHSKDKIEKAIQRLNKRSNKYLKDLESSDTEEQEPIRVLLKQTKDRLLGYEKLEAQLQRSNEAQISTTDADCRKLSKGKGYIIGVNVQAAADTDNKMIAAFDVINQSDDNALFPMASLIKDATGLEEIVVIADSGYENGQQIKECEDHGITTVVSPRQNSSPKPEGYRKQNFVYDEQNDEYTCPNGCKLTKRGKAKPVPKKGKRRTVIMQDYRADASDCKKCPNWKQCVTAKMLNKNYGRLIQRRENEKSIERNRDRVKQNYDLYKKRKQIIEHPFGTIKRSWGYTYTLLKGLKKIKGEFAMIFFCYNLRRLMSISEITCLVS